MKALALLRFAIPSLLMFLATAVGGFAQTSPTPNPLPPSAAVAIEAPTNGASFLTGADIPICAAVTGGVATSVEFFGNGTNILGIVTNFPEAGPAGGPSTTARACITWSNVPPGAYSLTAVANVLIYPTNGSLVIIDETVTSAPVNITVSGNPPPPPPPSVAITTPTNGATFFAGSDIGVCADATESGSYITTVQFFAGDVLIGAVTNPPVCSNCLPPIRLSYCITWSNAPAGDFALTAVATGLGGLISTSAPVDITVLTNLPPPPSLPLVAIETPTNGSVFLAGTDIQVCAAAGDTDGVAAVQFFAGTNSLGVSSNFAIIDPIAGRPILYHQYFCLTWSNAPAGDFDLTAVAISNDGLMGTSAPVSIMVVSNLPPPPPPPPTVAITTPANGSTFDADSDIEICATANDGTGTVANVEFLAGTNILGVVTNNPIVLPPGVGAYIRAYCLTWSNVPPGDYTLTAIATDTSGLMGTSAPVSIDVLTNLPPPPPPPIMVIESPANGATFLAGADIEICASGRDPSGHFVTTEFFEGTNSLGIVTNYPVVPIEPVASIIYSAACLTWSNATAGAYALTAVGTDNNGLMVTSAPVDINVVAPPPPPTNVPPVVSIYAPDPIAIEGTNFLCFTPPRPAADYFGGTNTATFLVARRGDTNADLTVYYNIGGTASNGVDYVTIPNNVTIPAAQRYALITIIPLKDIDPAWRPFDTVILTLEPSPVSSSSYTIGTPAKAAAIILEDDCLPPTATTVTNLPDCTFHLCMPGTNGLNYCLQVTTNLTDWIPVCTNTVVKGAVDFIDPDACDIPHRFYRVVPAAGPALY